MVSKGKVTAKGYMPFRHAVLLVALVAVVFAGS